MRISLDILETPDQFRQKVNQAICDHLNSHVFTKLSKLENELEKSIRTIIESSAEYQELLSNKMLIGDFGFPQGDAKPYLGAIVDQLVKSITVTFTPFITSGKRISGSIKIGAIIEDFRDVLSLPEANISYYSRRFNGVVNLDWLSWLLEKGNKIIIRDFHIEYGSFGRSGEAVMRLGGEWRVNPIISGTITNNWITRAAKDKAIVEQELNRALEEFFSRII